MKIGAFVANAINVTGFLLILSIPGWCEMANSHPTSHKQLTELDRVFEKRKGAVLSAEAAIPTIKISKNTFWYEKDQLAEILKAANIITKNTHSNSIKEVKPINGGSYSGHISIVTIDRSALVDLSLPESYVIKEVKWAYKPGKISKRSDQTPQGELQSMRLVADKVIPAIEEGRKKMPSLPRLAHSRGVFKIYTNQTRKDMMSNDEVFITIMDLAPGQSLGSYIQQGLESSINKHKLSEVLADAGKALGAFHRLFADPVTLPVLNDPNPNLDEFKTTIHGDLHSENIYWAENDPVQFIDVATIAQTLNNKVSCTRELSYLFLVTKYAHFLFDEKDMINMMLESIAKGYGETLAPYNSRAIEEAALKLFKKWSLEACTGEETHYDYDQPADVLNEKLKKTYSYGIEKGIDSAEMMKKINKIIEEVKKDSYCQP
jgi:hypothetical protein